jgi:hypothetical protein
MKVIDLINKQNNNELMPKHIKINKLNYIYDDNRKTYRSEYNEFMSFDFTNNVLNMQVEIIEDEIDIQNIEEINIHELPINIEVIYRKIIELIQAVKQLDKKIKED